MKFLMYDVETANRDVGSICAVGWACLDGDEVVDSGYSLINPNMHFSPYNTRVHGLTEKDVQNAPTFGEYWESTLKKHMESSVIIAHSAAFDISATEQALKYASIDDPGIDYIDTLPIFEQFLSDLPNHRLETCAEWAGFTFRHHHAQEDALAIVAVVNALCKEFGFHGFDELIVRGLVSKNTLTNSFKPKEEKAKKSIGTTIGIPMWAIEGYPSTEPIEPVDNALLGCKFCITGDVPGMDREQVQALIERHGGRLTSSVSKRTQFLIAGIYTDYPDDYVSGKKKTALELIEQGEAISILDPQQFLDLMRDPMANGCFCRYADAMKAKQQQEEEKARKKEQRAAQRIARAERNEQKENSAKPKRRVLRLNLDGTIVAEYSSVADASAACGVNVKCIRDAANGVQRTAGGFTWQFVEDSQE